MVKELNDFINQGIVEEWGQVNDERRKQDSKRLLNLLMEENTRFNMNIPLIHRQLEELAFQRKLKPLLRSGVEKVAHWHTTLHSMFNGSFSAYRKFMDSRFPPGFRHLRPPYYEFRVHELPLHRACRQGHSLGTIEILVKAFPKSVQVPDNSLCLPLHCACGVYGDKHKHDLEVVLYLMDVFPKAVEFMDRKGCLPLHHAVQSAAPLEVVQALVQRFPRAVHISRKKKNTEDPDTVLLEEGHLPLDHANKRTDYKDVQDYLHLYTFHPCLEMAELDAIFEKVRENPVGFRACPDAFSKDRILSAAAAAFATNGNR